MCRTTDSPRRAYRSATSSRGRRSNRRSAAPLLAKGAHVHSAQRVDASCEAVSIRYNNKVYELQRQGRDVTTLSLGEAFFEIPLFSFDELPLEKIYHYSHSRGIPELREVLAQTYRQK